MSELATAVVTGAADGLGAAVARRFAAEGHRVVLADREADDVEAVAEEIRADGGAATAVRADVRDEFDVERLMETAAREGSAGVDVVVAAAETNHGTSGQTPLAAAAYAAFDDTLRTNARGVFATVREAVPHLTDDARVLVPSTAVARQATEGHGPYAVSKAAAEALARQFAAELPQVVGVVDTGSDGPGAGGSDAGDDVAPDDETVSVVLWAATEAPAEAVDGAVVDAESRQTSRG